MLINILTDVGPLADLNTQRELDIGLFLPGGAVISDLGPLGPEVLIKAPTGAFLFALGSVGMEPLASVY